jgi:RNA ligase (TIGR02306 family)
MSSLLVEVCAITEVNSHPNANALDILTIKGWNVVEKKGLYKPGDTIVFFPPDSILPVELSDRLQCTQYLNKQRIRAARLRGIVSCGLVAPNEGSWDVGTNLAEHYNITKYDPPEPGIGGGQNIKDPNDFQHYTNIENWNNYPNIFEDGEPVVIGEKIHGSNIRAALIQDKFFIGSHYRTKVMDESVVYWQVAIRYNIEQKMQEKLPQGSDWILFGEVFGKRVQDLTYGLDTIGLRLFDIARNGLYLDYDNFVVVCDLLDLPRVPILYRGPYDKKNLANLAEGKAFQGDHIKEGVVIKPVQERWDKRLGRVILKKINPEYLVRKNGTEFY